MTAKKWLTPLPPQALLEWVRADISDRKLRLIAVAQCRRVWDHLPDIARYAVELAERYADGHARIDDLRRESERCDAEAEAMAPSSPLTRNAAAFTSAPNMRDGIAWRHTLFVSYATQRTAMWGTSLQGRRRFNIALRSERAYQAKLVRDVVGNPFRPVTLEPRWLTETVSALAVGIYVEKAFDRLPILADTLEDAGCDCRDLLDHLRGKGPHVRGCWALDLILGKC